MGPGEGVLEQPIPGRTRKPYNPLKGIHNIVPKNPDSTLKGIQYLVQIKTQRQWPRGITVPT